MVAVSEALALGQKLGIDINILANIMKTSTSRYIKSKIMSQLYILSDAGVLIHIIQSQD